MSSWTGEREAPIDKLTDDQRERLDGCVVKALEVLEEVIDRGNISELPQPTRQHEQHKMQAAQMILRYSATLKGATWGLTSA